MKKNEKGFGAVEALVIIIILATIGASGYYVYSRNKTATKSTKTTAITTDSNKTADMPTDSNILPKSKSGSLKYEKISFFYPADWTIVDSSESFPKDGNSCTYPGHDKVTLTSPSGSKMDFNAGQACFGYKGDINYGSIPIKTLGQNLYLSFLGYIDPEISGNIPDAACLVQTADAESRFFPSKNIFFNDAESKPTSNMICYTPKEKVTSADSIKQSIDYNAATRIIESMKY